MTALFACYLRPWLDPPVAVLRYVTYLIDDVMFAPKYNGQEQAVQVGYI